MRLDKYLSEMGLDSRTDLKKHIRKGEVLVDGRVIKDPAFQLVPEEAPEVFYRGQKVHYRSYEYYMMNKPAGVISASEDKRQETVLDLMQGQLRRDLFPAGRLDRDTEGLLLITNDGQLAHRLLSPKQHVEKLYFARVSGRITEADCERFRRGIRYDETLTALPAELRILKAGEEESEVLTTICEGKFHQIKKMFAALGDGREVRYLKRLSIGGLRLDEGLAPGEYRRLTEEEVLLLTKDACLPPA